MACFFASGYTAPFNKVFPMYHMYGEQPTAKQLILKAVKAASGWLRYVYAGNM